MPLFSSQVAASNLRLYNEAALNYLQACSLSHDPAAREGFQHVMELLLSERERYAPPKRTLYLKVRTEVLDFLAEVCDVVARRCSAQTVVRLLILVCCGRRRFPFLSLCP
jgi:hypothetical protein